MILTGAVCVLGVRQPHISSAEILKGKLRTKRTRLTSGGSLAFGRPFITLMGCDMAMMAEEGCDERATRRRRRKLDGEADAAARGSNDWRTVRHS